MADTGSPNSATCANSPPGPERLRHSGLAKSGPPVDELSMCPTFFPRNLRDLGALPTGGGCRVRRGVLFRCEGPGSFDESHHAELASLCIRSGADLRLERERATVPYRWTGNRCWVLDRGLRLRSHGGQLSPYAERFPAPPAGDGRRRAGWGRVVGYVAAAGIDSVRGRERERRLAGS